MYRIKMEKPGFPNAYRWFQDGQVAHLVAIAIVRNKDYDRVTVENLRDKVSKTYVSA